MKKIFLLVLILCLFLCGCGKKNNVPINDLETIMKRGYIIVGVRDDTAPFGFKDEKGNYIGFDIDLAKTIAQALFRDENKILFVPVTASNRISILNSGEVDMLIATMSITEQREQFLNFSRPYYTAGQAILTRSSSNATNLKDFRGKKLIIVFGSTGEEDLRANAPDVEILGFKTYKEAYNALKAGKAAGIMADDTILMGFAYNDVSVKILPKRYSQEPYAVVFRKDPESLTLMNKVDYIVETLQTTGRMNRLKEKWGL